MDLKKIIRHVQDFPKRGIGFKDITPLLADGSAFSIAIEQMGERFAHDPIDRILGIESRGFIFAAALARARGIGMIPVRKPGKLPCRALRETYQLEYREDALEIHADALTPDQRILIVDDLLATGGTAAATVRLVHRTGAAVTGCCFLVELDFLHGRELLAGTRVESLIHFESE